MTLGIKADLEAAAHRVEAWCGEPLLHEGEAAEAALAPGTARRAALDAAIAEMGRGATAPSYEWLRDFSLILGLDRVLSDPQPKLASGTTLRRHQVDALAGQLAALISDVERGVAADDEEDDDEPAENGDAPAENGNGDGNGNGNGNGEAFVELLGPEDPTQAVVEDVVEEGEHGPDPGARRRYRFKHPTASGKTIAAAGFVEAARTTGVLILTHRRLLVDQFTRDLTKEGYGDRLHGPVLRGETVPQTPPLTINTYSWFIKHAASIREDLYGVVVCDEAHTALGDKTAAAIRSFSEPVYIGMTATDQLLQKHVGDVFPAEVADFPLAEAVRRGVVAPLRCSRVRPIASLRSVEIVGGDFDQSQLAAALDLDPLNLAAADLYKSRFGDTPGIVYAAGVEHAERIAASMKAIGLKAGAVSGKTPPRQLAETLAAYDRGEINVLVNAQLLAEGWNAPRATVCMHLAPTASRRVYQQRVGRIMRLHRRKEAGIVVDFAEPGAPHTERVITLHSLLGVDAYRPNGLVTPPPPRRRRWRRRPAKPIVKEGNWIVPVSDDPERRIAVIANQWRLVDASKLPLDEQRAWAVVAARAVSPADVQMLAERITGLQPEARELFFFTCSAENKHRRLRLQALGDLASQGPTQTTFAMACRLVEAAPTWQQDRGQGARVLLLAMGDERIEAPDDRIVTWTWQLARAARDHEYRYAGSHVKDGRSLLGALAAASGEAAHTEAAAKLAAVATSSPLEAGAALLAVRLAAQGDDGRAAGRAGARRALSRLPPAGRGARLEHPCARTARQDAEARQGEGEGARRHHLVQRRRGRLDAPCRVGSSQRRRRDRRGDATGRRPAARRCRPGGDPAARRVREAGLGALRRRRPAVRHGARGALCGRRPGAAGGAGGQAGQRVEARADGPGLRRGRGPGGAARPRGGRGAARRRRPQGACSAEDGRRARPRAGRVRAGGRRGADRARLAARRCSQDRPRRAGRRVVRAPRPAAQVAVARPQARRRRRRAAGGCRRRAARGVLETGFQARSNPRFTNGRIASWPRLR